MKLGSTRWRIIAIQLWLSSVLVFIYGLFRGWVSLASLLPVFQKFRPTDCVFIVRFLAAIIASVSRSTSRFMARQQNSTRPNDHFSSFPTMCALRPPYSTSYSIRSSPSPLRNIPSYRKLTYIPSSLSPRILYRIFMAQTFFPGTHNHNKTHSL